MRYFAVRWQWRLCVDLRLLNVLWNNGCRIGRKSTARTFALLCALELEYACYLCLMQYEVVMHPKWSHPHACAILLHYNGDDGSALIFVGWMYGTGVALVVHEQRVRLYCFVCALELEWRVYWRSMQYDEVILATSYAISLSTYTIYNNGDDGFLLIFVRWTYVTGVVLSMDKQAVRWPCCVCVHSNLTVLLVFDAVCDCNVILIIYTAMTACVDLRLLNVWNQRVSCCWP